MEVVEAFMSCNNGGERRASNGSRRKKGEPFIWGKRNLPGGREKALFCVAGLGPD